MAIPPIPKEIGDTLHARLISGCDLQVTAEIAETFLPGLIRCLKSRFRLLRDPHWIPSIAADTLAHYLADPHRYDPSAGNLASYLCMDATGDMLNLLEQQRAEEQKLVQFDPTDPEQVNEGPKAEDDPESLLVRNESPLLAPVLALFPDPLDRALVLLMVEDSKDTERFAMLLGIQHLPAAKQRKIINRNKNRLKKSIRRRIRRKNSR